MRGISIYIEYCISGHYIQYDHKSYYEPDLVPDFNTNYIVNKIQYETHIYSGTAVRTDHRVLTYTVKQFSWYLLVPFKTLEKWKLAYIIIEEKLNKFSIYRLIKWDLIRNKVQIPNIHFQCKVIVQKSRSNAMLAEWTESTIKFEEKL